MKKKLSLVLTVLACFAFILGGTAVYVFSGEKYRVLADDEQVIVRIGDKIDVEKRTLVYEDQSKVVDGKIISPSGASYEGNRFAVTEAGIYNVVYKAYFEKDGKIEEVDRSVKYLCERKSTDFFLCNDAATAYYGTYSHSTKTVEHKGVILEMKQGASVTFDLTLDADNLNLDTPLINFIVDPSEIGVDDFTELTIRISDVNDEKSYVEILCIDGGRIDMNGTGTCVRAGFDGGITAGYEAWVNKYITSNTGTGVWHSFHAYPSYEPTHDMSLYLDYASKKVYGSPSAMNYGNKVFINDFSGNNDLYKFSPWQGFTSGKVRVSIIPSKFKNPTGKVLIKSVVGISFENEFKPDEIAPQIKIDYDGQDSNNLPLANVGRAYKIFSSVVTDNYDEGLEADVSVTYRDSVNKRNVNVSVKNGEFTPEKEGVYTITYRATDRSGNEAESVKLRISTTDSEELILSSDFAVSDADVYSTVKIPETNDISVNGGSGKVYIERTIITPDGKSLYAEGDSFVPEIIGKYVIRYSAKDYVGKTGETSYELNVVATDAPVFTGEIQLPPVLVKGFSYKISVPEVVDASFSEQTEIIPVVRVNGEQITDSFVAEGNSVTVEFEATGKKGTTLKTFELPVIDGKNATDQAAYFYNADGNVTVTENEDDVTLSTGKDAKVDFANRLDASSFSATFEIRKADLKYISFILRDASDKNVSVTLNLDVASGILYFGKESMVFSAHNGLMRLQYKNSQKRLLDVKGKEIYELSKDDAGNIFNGFSDGVYLSVEFKGVRGECSVAITKLGNHALGNKGESEHADVMDPIISLRSSLKSEQFVGDMFEYPAFDAFDVFSDIAETKIRVTDPKGNRLVSGDKDTTETFKITEYGRYRITYIVKDSSGNETSLPKTVFVNDAEAPELTVGNLSKTEYKIGDAVSLPSYEASDNLGSVIVDVILVLPNNETRLLTHEEDGEIIYSLTDESIYGASFRNDENSFRTEMAGKHCIRVVAYDDQYNMTVKTLYFTVK